MPADAPSISRSALWNHLGRVADFALLYVVSVLIARGLGIEAYGHFATLLSGVSLLLVASSFGLEAALTRHCAALEGEDVFERIRFLLRRSAALRIGLLLTSATALAFLAENLRWISLPRESGVILLVAGFSLSRAILPLSVAALTARFDTMRVAVISVAGRAVEVAGLLLWGHDGLTLWLVLVILFFAGCVQIALHLIGGSRVWWGRERAVPLAPIIAFGGMFWLNSLIDFFLGRQGDIALLSILKRDSVATSHYDVSYTLLQAGAMVATLGLSGVSLAALSRLPAGETAPRKILYEKLVRLNSFLTIPVLGFIFVAAPEILGVVYSGPFVGASTILRILVGLRIFSRLFAGGENADILLSLDLVRPLLWVGAVGAAATIALHLALIPQFAAEGAAVASGLGSLAANVLGVVRVRRTVPIGLQWRSWLVLVGLSVMSGLAALWLVTGSMGLSGLVLKALVFGTSWVLFAILGKPLEQGDAAVLGRAMPILGRPVGLLARRGGVA
jgi:O-antigen/teichoic acid export membrane protein